MKKVNWMYVYYICRAIFSLFIIILSILTGSDVALAADTGIDLEKMPPLDSDSGQSSPPGDGQQPPGEVDQPAEAMGPEAPDSVWLKEHIPIVFKSIDGKKPRKDTMKRLFSYMKLETACPEQRRRILSSLVDLEKARKGRKAKKNELKLHMDLLRRFYGW